MFDAIDRADRRISALLNPPPAAPASGQPGPRRAEAGPGPDRSGDSRHHHGHGVPWEFIGETIAYKLERRRLRELRRLERERLKAERRRMRGARNPGAGVLMFVFAGVLAYLAFIGKPFWLVFVALGLALSGVSQFRGRGEGALPEREPEAAGPTDESRRVDEIAKSLMKELKEGPAILREIVVKPEATVEGLRRGYHALEERERKLRALVTAQDEQRLEAERVELVARRDRSTDPVARSRYDEALRALDLQREERVAVIRAAERMEAERTRLRYTLEGLHAQVVRARSTHGLDQANDEALRSSLERLSDEVSAVTEALESVSSVSPPARVR